MMATDKATFLVGYVGVHFQRMVPDTAPLDKELSNVPGLILSFTLRRALHLSVRNKVFSLAPKCSRIVI